MAEQRNRYSYDGEDRERPAYVFETEGNAARQLFAAEEYYDDDSFTLPAMEPEEETEELSRLRRLIGPDTVHETKIRRKLNFSIINVMLIAGMLIVLFAFSVRLVYLRSEITHTEKLIGKADLRLEDVSRLNESLSVGLDAEPDRNYIYSVAVGKLGMVYPDGNEVVSYEAAEVGYVRQYSVIR